jgi:hypothetical protein
VIIEVGHTGDPPPLGLMIFIEAGSGTLRNTGKRVLAVLITAAAAAALACLSAGAAQAAEDAGTSDAAGGPERCPNGYVCLFDGANGTGKMAYFKQGSQNLGLQGMDNMTSSWMNRSGVTFNGYDGYGSNPGRYVFGSDGAHSGLFNLFGSEDNTMSSLRRG